MRTDTHGPLALARGQRAGQRLLGTRRNFINLIYVCKCSTRMGNKSGMLSGFLLPCRTNCFFYPPPPHYEQFKMLQTQKPWLTQGQHTAYPKNVISYNKSTECSQHAQSRCTVLRPSASEHPRMYEKPRGENMCHHQHC